MADRQRYAVFEKLCVKIARYKEWAGDPSMWFNCFYSGLGKITPVYVCCTLSEDGQATIVTPYPAFWQGNWDKVKYEVHIHSQNIMIYKNGTIIFQHTYTNAQLSYMVRSKWYQLDSPEGS